VLTATGLAKAHGTRVLFDDVSFALSPGRRVALVGSNGTGKTTLLEIVAGLQQPDRGGVHKPSDLRIGYLPQEGMAVPEGTVLEEVLRGAEEVAALAERLGELEHLLATARGEAHDRALAAYGEAQDRFHQLGGYAIEADAHRVLDGLGFDAAAAGRPVRELSGGWRMRVGLARLLLGQPDVLLLDEPTNHLDVDSVAWLEQHLAASRGALLFVSHDRDFIDGVANRVLELAGGVVTEYVGGFAEFVAEREERLERLKAAAATQAKQVADVERFVERFRYKATKARQVQSRVKALEKLDRVEVPDEKALKLRFAFPEPPRSSRVVAELRDVTVGYGGEPVLRDVDLVLERGQRLALVGPNGAGKTTLLKALLGEIEPDRGEIVLGGGVAPGAFAQHQADVLEGSRTVLEEFRAGVGDRFTKNMRALLGAFGFPGDTADKRVGVLSGGERARLALAKLMVEPVNLLVLDEPTNHLDLQSCDVVEDAVRAWPGTVLLVTHDRYLIREVATGLVEVRHGTARQTDGVDEAVLQAGGTGAPAAPARPSAPAPSGRRPAASAGAPTPARGGGRQDGASRKRAEAEQRNRRSSATRPIRQRVAAAERAWERAEAVVAELQRELADPATYDGDGVVDVVRRHDDAKAAAAAAMAEWEAAVEALEAAEARLEAGAR
jgi:ATP-binding cassette subfamily F protein 3